MEATRDQFCQKRLRNKMKFLQIFAIFAVFVLPSVLAFSCMPCIKEYDDGSTCNGEVTLTNMRFAPEFGYSIGGKI